MDSKVPLTEDDINKFKKDYFEQVEFDYWQERLSTAYRRYSKLKRPENKAKYIVEIYSIYIQVIEILLINMHALSVPSSQFLSALALENYEIRDYAKKIVNNPHFLRGFTHNFLYKVRGIKKNDTTTDEKIRSDVNLLKECLKDYTENFNFLNSYKHGFRLHSAHGNNYVALGTSPDNMVQVATGDSRLTYYEFKKSKGQLSSVSEVSLTFNHMRIVGKALFAIYYLENIRLGILAAYSKPKKITYPVFYINDKEAWSKDFGQSRFKSVLFTFKKDV